MGNEQSQIPGIDIDEKAIEVNDFWSQHSARIVGSDNVIYLSVFIGEIFVNGTLWTTQTPLEKCIKNLMIFRHPCIIKYISSWKNNSKFHLAVEEVIPLAQVLPTLDNLQISVGLHSILKALEFLHTYGSASHNNVCISSIYVTKEGSWKLGGMEYLTKYKELSCDYLNKTRNNRYNKAVDPNEEKFVDSKLNRKDFIDIYAFGALVSEILKSQTDGKSPSHELSVLIAFCDYCKNELQQTNISKRPCFKNILEHEFFNQDFITIHSFLVELPLKTDEQKAEFFDGLIEKLKLFDEHIIASQLSGLLLSRLVLLNQNAEERLLPVLLTPKTDVADDSQSNLIFSKESFKSHLLPKILDIFRVRDAQIRLLMLQHLPKFMHLFTHNELLTFILPELLVGVKDTDDHLVAMTLRALADLVDVLGAEAVIGGKRAKLFNDGRPVKARAAAKRFDVASPPTSVEGKGSACEAERMRFDLQSRNIGELPERPSPDGEEGETSTEEVEVSVDDENDMDNWEDWDLNDGNHHHPRVSDLPTAVVIDEPIDTLRKPSQTKAPLPEIEQLDIKNQVAVVREEFDFFRDMEPVIARADKYLVEEGDSSAIGKLALKNEDNVSGEDGWADEDWG